MATPITPGRVTQKQRMASNGQIATPPNGSQPKRLALGEIDHNEGSGSHVEDNLPVPTPGQPRKSHRKDSRNHLYCRDGFGVESESEHSTAHLGRSGHRRLTDQSESEEELRLDMLSQGVSSRSPAASPTRRSISHSAAMTSSIHEDVENWGESGMNKPKTLGSTKSGSGVLGVGKVRSSPRRTADSKHESKGIRKVSGRVGSAGTVTKVK